MDNDNEFLEEMQNDKYVNQIELDKQQEKEDKKQDKIDKKQNRIDSKITKAQKNEEKQQQIQKKLEEKQENKINESTEIIGKNRRSLLNKINKYKKIYKTQLSDYKIMKNATELELQEHIQNIEDILDNSEVDNFINDSIFHSIKMIEPLTSNTRFNVTGLSSMLKLNSQFLNLTNRLILKYNLFSNTPIEYQFLMCISTSVYLTIQMNKSKPAMEQFLNQKI